MNEQKANEHLVRALQKKYGITDGETMVVLAVIDNTVKTLLENREDSLDFS